MRHRLRKHLPTIVAIGTTVLFLFACIHPPTRTAFQGDAAPLGAGGDETSVSVGVLLDTGLSTALVAGVDSRLEVVEHFTVGGGLNTMGLGLLNADMRVGMNSAADPEARFVAGLSVGVQFQLAEAPAFGFDTELGLRFVPRPGPHPLALYAAGRINPVSGEYGTFPWGTFGGGFSVPLAEGRRGRFPVLGLEASRLVLVGEPGGLYLVQALIRSRRIGPPHQP